MMRPAHSVASPTPPGDVVIRPARLGDLAALVRIHMDVFEGHRAVRLGRAYVQAGHRWFLAQADTINLVAESGEALVGFVEGAPSGYARRLAQAVQPVALRAFLMRPWLILDANFRYALGRRLSGWMRRSAPAKPSSVPCEGETFSLVSIGVAREAQGRGIAGLLMKAFEEKAQEVGYDCLRLSVYRSNTRAARAYHKAGWHYLDVGDTHSTYYWKPIRPGAAQRAPGVALDRPSLYE